VRNPSEQVEPFQPFPKKSNETMYSKAKDIYIYYIYNRNM